MRLTNPRIEDRGVHGGMAAIGAAERICFTVEGSGNLDGLVLIDSAYEEGEQLSNVHRHTFPFPYREVNDKDVIVVHSGPGTDYAFAAESSENPAPRHHHFFMNLTSTVWDKNPDRCYIGRLRVLWAFDV